MDSKFKTFKIQRLDPISSSFCAAKWYRADLYLHTGTTSSCNYPAPGKIDLDQVSHNVLAIHNTPDKIAQRQLMLDGVQPSACSNCWNVENVDPDAISDRMIFSHGHRRHDFTKVSAETMVAPDQISIIFDNFCNFSCMYCDPTQSTTWASDLKINGPIKTITDPKKTYMRLGTKDRLDETQYQFLYQKLLEMLEQNLSSMKLINFVGGEPTMSPYLEPFLDWLSTKDVSHLSLSMNTNFSNQRLIRKYLDRGRIFKHQRLLISIDGTQKKSEFIRSGLDWSSFDNNVREVFSLYPGVEVSFSGTLNIFSLDSLIESLDWYTELSKQKSDLSYIIAITRWPNFQSIKILPRHLKNKYQDQINQWIEKNHNDIADTSVMLSLKRIVTVLSDTSDDHRDPVDEKIDLKNFTIEYARRRKLDVQTTFSKELCDWLFNL